MCLLIGIGTNGETYFNTIALVSCVKNFPKSRGPVVGILKGFTGLCGAILTQYYASLFAPNHAAFILMVAVGPSMIAIALMFILRPVGGCKETDPSDHCNFNFLYGVCLLLAGYLLGVMLVQDFVEIERGVNLIFTLVLLLILILPLALPLISACKSNYTSTDLDPTIKRSSLEESLLINSRNPESDGSKQSNNGQGGYQRQDSSVNWNEVLMSEIEDEKPKEIDLLPERERQKRIAQLQARLLHAAAEGAVRIKRRKGKDA